MTISAEKAALRRIIAAQRDTLTDDEQKAASERLAMLVDTPEFHAFLPGNGGVISGYWPIRSELDPLPLMQILAGKGYQLAFPRIDSERLSFHIATPDTLIPGPFGTREPAPDAPLTSPALILTPLLAYDDRGGRLGYGKGYYDAAFTTHPNARRVGLAHHCQRVDTVPREAHDVLIEYIFAV